MINDPGPADFLSKKENLRTAVKYSHITKCMHLAEMTFYANATLLSVMKAALMF